MVRAWSLLGYVAATSLLVACGESDGSDASNSSAGSGGGPGAADPFPDAPECEEGYIHVTGTLAGEAYQGGAPPSNWSPTNITFGVGETDGSLFGNEYQLVFAERLTLGTKVAVTQGYLYVVDPGHSLTAQYVCIQAGEAALVQGPPDATVLIEFAISAGAMGQYCDGAPVDLSLNGCISRTSTYVP